MASPLNNEQRVNSPNGMYRSFDGPHGNTRSSQAGMSRDITENGGRNAYIGYAPQPGQVRGGGRLGPGYPGGPLEQEQAEASRNVHYQFEGQQLMGPPQQYVDRIEGQQALGYVQQGPAASHTQGYQSSPAPAYPAQFPPVGPVHHSFEHPGSHTSTPASSSRPVTRDSAVSGGSGNDVKYNKKNPKACDPCRRAKAKCNGTPNTGNFEDYCNRCKKKNIHCASSKVDKKRGPKAGYIQKLQRQLDVTQHYLERMLKGGLGAQLLNEYQRDSAAVAEDDSSENGIKSARKSSIQEFATVSPRTANFPGTPAFPSVVDNSIQMDPSLAQYESAELNLTNLDIYYGEIHHTYQLLPNSREVLQAHLDQCDAVIRSVLFKAIDFCAESFLSSNSEISDTITPMLSNLIHSEVIDRSAQNKVALIQASALMAVAISHITSHSVASLSAIVHLTVAVAIADNLRLYEAHGNPDLPDGAENVHRRLWFALVMMDRWFALMHCALPKIPDEAVALFPEDNQVLGEPVVEMLYIMMSVGHTTVSTIYRLARKSAEGPFYGKTLLTELNSFYGRWSNEMRNPTGGVQVCNLNMAYAVASISIELRSQYTDPDLVLEHASKIVSQSLAHFSPLAPFALTFVVYALIEILKLADRQLQDGANFQLTKVRELQNAWGHVLCGVIDRLTQPLHHLAEAAVGDGLDGLWNLFTRGVINHFKQNLPHE